MGSGEEGSAGAFAVGGDQLGDVVLIEAVALGPVLIHRSPQVAPLVVDRDEHLVEMPFVPRASPAPAQGVGAGLPELRTPLPYRLVGCG